MLYKLFTNQRRLSVPIIPLFVCMSIAAGCIYGTKMITANPVAGVALSTGAYLIFIFLFRLLHIRDLHRLKSILIN